MSVPSGFLETTRSQKYAHIPKQQFHFALLSMTLQLILANIDTLSTFIYDR